MSCRKNSATIGIQQQLACKRTMLLPPFASLLPWPWEVKFMKHWTSNLNHALKARSFSPHCRAMIKKTGIWTLPSDTLLIWQGWFSLLPPNVNDTILACQVDQFHADIGRPCWRLFHALSGGLPNRVHFLLPSVYLDSMKRKCNLKDKVRTQN